MMLNNLVTGGEDRTACCRSCPISRPPHTDLQSVNFTREEPPFPELEWPSSRVKQERNLEEHVRWVSSRRWYFDEFEVTCTTASYG
jgi:hypothetical protein